jgi:hypothetical protein
MSIRKVALNWINKVINEKERIQRIVMLNPIFKGRDFLVDNKLSFVLIPFREPFFRLYEEVIKPALGKYFKVMKANDIFTAAAIIEDI